MYLTLSILLFLFTQSYYHLTGRYLSNMKSLSIEFQFNFYIYFKRMLRTSLKTLTSILTKKTEPLCIYTLNITILK